MQEQSLFRYIWLGTCIRYLMDASPSMPIWDFREEGGGGNAIHNLDALRNHLVTDKLAVSLTHYDMHGLRAFTKGLRARVDEAKDGTPGLLMLSTSEARSLRDLAQSLRRTMDAESSNSVAYVAHDRRHTANTLLHDMSALLADGAFEDLPKVAQFDFTEAGRAVAFDLPSAAGFHLMRATEAALLAYYKRLIKQNRLKTPMWGSMVEALRAKKQKPPPSHLLDHLDTIRKNFRNPTQHPEKIYNLEEAQDLLSLAADAISRMYRDSQERGLTGQPG